MKGPLAFASTIAAMSGAAWYQLWRRPLPQISGTRVVDGIAGPIEIRRDRWGVPHVAAGNLCDLLFGQGFCHGQDRLWQLDLFRRVASGRLSEIAGDDMLATDRLFRTLGLHRVAAREAVALDAGLLGDIEAYCAGVNAAAAAAALPFELQLLRRRFEPWRPVDALTVQKLLAWGQATNWERELLRGDLVEHLGPELAARLEPPYPIANPVATQQPWTGDALGLVEQVDRLRRTAGMPPGAIGSNNWAIAGSRSATGGPLLAGDPHLPSTMPALGYQQGLRLNERFVRGLAFPGAPGVVMGQTNDVAWSFTNAMADVEDLYVERIDGDRYLFDGEWRKLEVVREEIQVKGRPQPVVLDVRHTHHGPIVNEFLDTQDSAPLALRWAGHDAATIYQGALRFHEVTSGAELVASMAAHSTPALSLVWADRHGSIGLKMVGAIPVRRGNCPDLPKPGWTSEFEWDGTVAYEELPELTNPDDGFVVSANNRLVGDDYPHHITSDWFDGSRARRIEQLIRDTTTHDLDDLQAMQLDVHSIPGLQTARLLAATKPAGTREQAGIERLRAWDGSMDADSVAATIYQEFTHQLGRRFARAVIGDENLAERWLDRAGNGFETHMMAPWRWQTYLLDRWAEADDSLIGRPWDELALEALKAALDVLEDRFGRDAEAWRWGRVHQMPFAHALGDANPLLARLLNRRVPVGGGQETVNQAAWDLAQPYDVIWGACWRMVADPRDPDRSRWQIFAGQSGHPASPHYDDLQQRWCDGQMQPMRGEGPWQTLLLEPSDGAPSRSVTT
jgi:penicillin amidase